MIEHPRACGARPAMLAPFGARSRRCAPAAGAARLQLPVAFSFFLPLRAQHTQKNHYFGPFRLPLRVIKHPRACGARPAMLAHSALAAGAARLPPFLFSFFFFFFLFTPAGNRTSSRLRRSARNARAFGARSRRCAPAAGAVRLPQALRARGRRCAPAEYAKNHDFGP